MIGCYPNPHTALTALCVLACNILSFLLHYWSSQWCCKLWSLSVKFSILKPRQKAEQCKQVAWSSVNSSCSCPFAIYRSVILQEDLGLPNSSPNAFVLSFHSSNACPPVVFLPSLPRETSDGVWMCLVLQKFLGAHNISYKLRDSLGINQLRTSCYSVIPLFPPVPHETSTGMFPFPEHPVQWNSSDYSIHLCVERFFLNDI